MIISKKLSIVAEDSPKDGFQYSARFNSHSMPLIGVSCDMLGVVRED